MTTTLDLIAEHEIDEIEADLGEKLSGYSFSLAVIVDPFNLELDGEPSSSMTYYTGNILLLHPDDGSQLGVAGEVEFAIADLRKHGPHWVLDGDADDYSIAHLFEAF